MEIGEINKLIDDLFQEVREGKAEEKGLLNYVLMELAERFQEQFELVQTKTRKIFLFKDPKNHNGIMVLKDEQQEGIFIESIRMVLPMAVTNYIEKK